eukprot:c15956_g1_i1 orf=9-200(+)
MDRATPSKGSIFGKLPNLVATLEGFLASIRNGSCGYLVQLGHSLLETTLVYEGEGLEELERAE